MNELKNKSCVPCSEGSSQLPLVEIEKLHENIPEWQVVSNDGMNMLQRTFSFPDFRTALTFTNQVGELAEVEGHHPKLVTEWGKVTVVWWTHSLQGLHSNDFLMAAKTSELFTG